MIILRYLLFPFAILYGWITSIRNFLYDKGILKSYSFDIPIIAVGNLSVGGTGKTPQIEYLIRLLLPNYKIATLSRGYKRKSKGYVLADINSTAENLGDEPFQMHQKFPSIKVAVDADRKNGIENLIKLDDKPDVILLDDAFQHRKVKAGLYIMLSAYDDIFYDDFMLPTGNLRESRSGAKRADIIVITKCPKDLSISEQERIKAKIKFEVPIFFSFIDYDNNVYGEKETLEISEIIDKDKLIIAGIAKPEPFFNFIRRENDTVMIFSDHHDFSENDINTIREKSNGKIIITTEKDYVRLKTQNLNNLYYLPINSTILTDEQTFNSLVIEYFIRF
ncbi:tetraacyldisaccharide 4'-kinase [Flavobacterium aquatile]|uniref:Tetraacyldisaccharide 4'-kinase n=1 Tax=Flavobacterium aquatile LMG 4008 = ATCC 11947 TaxID=1453498 RepID=A0A095SV95_9FLAO|nr:tetraacyldisaccharide 4'-kinase [Flavobacterium aquatile]KGD68304.1 tetraacyldisaccharide 4'-kinase [Flavobacterium aquatile LMG 4008 = ATCC 11947]OXA68762.1 tetraacyldisaccharide 4'-kinase [Flavobacterium aquatile LMG 4008 = ATCC 11947]GEC77215.1 tetraacyldisaccharide 4'-kinase [Flavobacterium aquatile]